MFDVEGYEHQKKSKDVDQVPKNWIKPDQFEDKAGSNRELLYLVTLQQI